MSKKPTEAQKRVIEKARRFLKDHGLPDGSGRFMGVPLEFFSHSELCGLIEYAEQCRYAQAQQAYEDACANGFAS